MKKVAARILQCYTVVRRYGTLLLVAIAVYALVLYAAKAAWLDSFPANWVFILCTLVALDLGLRQFKKWNIQRKAEKENKQDMPWEL